YSAGQRARSKAPFHPLLGELRMRSRLLKIVPTVTLFVSAAGWVKRILIWLHADSSASAVAFGSNRMAVSRAVPGTPALPWSCGRRLNSSGQDCWFAGLELTQEI